LNPPLYILPQEIKIHGKVLILLDIPESSQVHRCNNRIYDRNEDGDFNITDNTNLVGELYIRKQRTKKFFSEIFGWSFIDYGLEYIAFSKSVGAHELNSSCALVASTVRFSDQLGDKQKYLF
jgi:predicted HTH transcriptional regulator